MRHLVNKVKQEKVGRETVSALDEVRNLGQGPEILKVNGTAEEAQEIGADFGTAVN